MFEASMSRISNWYISEKVKINIAFPYSLSIIELPVHTGTTTLSPGLTWAIMGSVTDRAYDEMDEER